MQESLWEQLGGEINMLRIVNDFVELAIHNPAVNYTRNGKFKLNENSIAFSKKSALEFLSTATSGPFSYSGRSIVDIHIDMNINDAEFDAISLDFRTALQKNGICSPLLEDVLGRVEGTRPFIVTANLQPPKVAANHSEVLR